MLPEGIRQSNHCVVWPETTAGTILFSHSTDFRTFRCTQNHIPSAMPLSLSCRANFLVRPFDSTMAAITRLQECWSVLRLRLVKSQPINIVYRSILTLAVVWAACHKESPSILLPAPGTQFLQVKQLANRAPPKRQKMLMQTTLYLGHQQVVTGSLILGTNLLKAARPRNLEHRRRQVRSSSHAAMSQSVLLHPNLPSAVGLRLPAS